MLCSCCTIRVTNYSGSLARSSGLRLNLPGIAIFARILLGNDLFENLTLRNELFMGIRTPGIAFRILHTGAHCHGHGQLQ